jgi:hypothetical protein
LLKPLKIVQMLKQRIQQLEVSFIWLFAHFEPDNLKVFAIVSLTHLGFFRACRLVYLLLLVIKIVCEQIAHILMSDVCVC